MHLKETGTPWEDCAAAGPWQDLWLHVERNPCWRRFCRGFATLWDTNSGGLCEGLQLWKGPTLNQFVKNSSLWEGHESWRIVSHGRHPTLEQWKNVNSLAEEEEVSEMCDELTTTFVPWFLVQLEEKTKKIKSESESGKEWQAKGKYFNIEFFFILICFVINYIFTSVDNKCFLPVLFLTNKAFVVFCLPCPAEEGDW